MSNTFVICMGMGVVFVGLICIVILISITGKIIQAVDKKKNVTPSASVNAAVMQPTVTQTIPNRGVLVAAISAALAEELGTTVQGLRILSLKRLGESAPSTRGELAAAISAVIAEEEGRDVSGIRIVSMKQI